MSTQAVATPNTRTRKEWAAIINADWRKFSKLPRFICISPKGGRGARHVMTLFAIVKHWEANFELKDAIAEATAMSRDESADMMRILRSKGAKNLHTVLTGQKGEFSKAAVVRSEEQPGL